ncbi:hypothetical protein DAMA08_023020 [Martiniozyma asiatica (nom. inval.)]|nr:hypothetical protein DAMA08_023020 [Martiniozyma asiatica]
MLATQNHIIDSLYSPVEQSNRVMANDLTIKCEDDGFDSKCFNDLPIQASFQQINSADYTELQNTADLYHGTKDVNFQIKERKTFMIKNNQAPQFYQPKPVYQFNGHMPQNIYTQSPQIHQRSTFCQSVPNLNFVVASRSLKMNPTPIPMTPVSQLDNTAPSNFLYETPLKSFSTPDPKCIQTTQRQNYIYGDCYQTTPATMSTVDAFSDSFSPHHHSQGNPQQFNQFGILNSQLTISTGIDSNVVHPFEQCESHLVVDHPIPQRPQQNIHSTIIPQINQLIFESGPIYPSNLTDNTVSDNSEVIEEIPFDNSIIDNSDSQFNNENPYFNVNQFFEKHNDDNSFIIPESDDNLLNKQREILELQLQKYKTFKLPSGLFGCPSCSLIFKDFSALKSHIIKHTSARPYACLNCNRKFKRRNDCKRHEKTHGIAGVYCHGRVSVTRNGEQKWVEWGCGMKYSRLEVLKGHWKRGTRKHNCKKEFLSLVTDDIQCRKPEAIIKLMGENVKEYTKEIRKLLL